MATFHARNGSGELLARYSFVEPLLEGRRVLEIGAARATEGGSALFLAERGAAAVLSVEPAESDLSEARKAGHHPFVQFQAARPQDLRAGTFDLILLADGSRLAAPGEVAALRRLLVPGGRLITAISAGGPGLPDLAGEPLVFAPPPYEAFVNALADQFALVEVAAQTATVGWVFGLATGEEPDIAMDGTLAGTPDTTAYVAIAGAEPSGLTGFTVVALPLAPLVQAAHEREAAAAGELESARASIARAEAAVQSGAEALAAEGVRSAELSQAVSAAEAERDRVRAESAAELLRGREETGAALTAEREASRAALDAERESARRDVEAAAQELDRLRLELEEAAEARDAARREAEGARAECGRVGEALARGEAERDDLARERDQGRAREAEAERSREVALAEAALLAESLARAEAEVALVVRDRDAVVAAQKAASEEAAELRLSLDEVKLARSALEAEVLQARGDAARIAGRLQEHEEAAAEAGRQRALLEEQEKAAALVSEGLRGRVEEQSLELHAERAAALDLRSGLKRASEAAQAQESELQDARLALGRAEEERARAEAALEERRASALDEQAALQAARSEVQASRAALEAALDRATRAESRNSDLEEALERAPGPEHLSRLAELEAVVGRVPELEAAAARLPGLEEQAARVPALEEAAAHAAELEEVAARLPELLEQVARARSLDGELARLPELEAAVARHEEEATGHASALLAARARIRELEATCSRVMAADAAASAVQEELERARVEQAKRQVAFDAELSALREPAVLAEEHERRAARAEERGDELSRAMDELKESTERTVADARRAAYEATTKVDEARKAADEARKELETVQAGAAGAADTAREWAQVREVLEARVAELGARLEVEAERSAILSAQAAEARAQLESAAERTLTAAPGGAGEALPPAELLRQGAEAAAAREALGRQLKEATNAAEVAEAEAAGLAAELQAVRWEKDELEGRLKALEAGAQAGMGDPLGLRDQLATRMAELAISKREVARLEEVVATLSVRTEATPGGSQDLEERLDVALQRATDAEAALDLLRASASGDHAEMLRRAGQEREAIAAQVAERDGRIARLQREVGDKTERLGRLAKELGELKAKGLGKIFR